MMKDNPSKQVESLLSGGFFKSMFILLSLLACFGSSYHLKERSGNVGPATLNETHNLSEDCIRIHNDLKHNFVSSYEPLDVVPYRVRLKLFTTHKDTLEILTMPAFANIKPIAIFNKDKHRGFTADFSKQQICDLYHLPAVS